MEFKKLQQEMIAAMKAKDKPRKEVISGLIAAVKKVAIDNGVRDNIPEDMVDTVILKELKAAQEQLSTCPDSREDLKQEYNFNLNVIKEFAPKQMDETEIKDYIAANFSDIIATKNKGLIMKSVMGQLKGKADGKLINQVVADLCK